MARVGVYVGTELLVAVIHHELAAAVVGLARRRSLEAGCLYSDRLGRRRDRIGQAMTQVALDTVAVATRREARSVRRGRAAGEPALGRVTAQTEISGAVEILLCDRKRRPEDRIGGRVGHHAAIPEVGRLGGRVISAMTVIATIRRLETTHLTGLRTGHLNRRRHDVRRLRGVGSDSNREYE